MGLVVYVLMLIETLIGLWLKSVSFCFVLKWTHERMRSPSKSTDNHRSANMKWLIFLHHLLLFQLKWMIRFRFRWEWPSFTDELVFYVSERKLLNCHNWSEILDNFSSILYGDNKTVFVLFRTVTTELWIITTNPLPALLTFDKEFTLSFLLICKNLIRSKLPDHMNGFDDYTWYASM